MRKKSSYHRRFGARSGPLARREVFQILTEIWKEHDRRRSSSFVAEQEFNMSKNEDAKNFLRREIYALGLFLTENPTKWDLTQLISDMRATKSTKEDSVRDRIFHLLLMGLFEEDSVISRQERWSMSRELEYARRHEIPPELICGFIFQSGGRSRLNDKLKAGFIEPAFRS